MFKLKNMFKSNEEVIHAEYLKLVVLHTKVVAAPTAGEPLAEEVKNTQLSILRNNYETISKTFQQYVPALQHDDPTTYFNMRGSSPRVCEAKVNYNSDKLTVLTVTNQRHITEPEQGFSLLNYSNLRRGMKVTVTKLIETKIRAKVKAYALTEPSNTDAILNYLLPEGPVDVLEVSNRYDLVTSVIELTSGTNALSVKPKVVVKLNSTYPLAESTAKFLLDYNTTAHDFII